MMKIGASKDAPMNRFEWPSQQVVKEFKSRGNLIAQRINKAKPNRIAVIVEDTVRGLIEDTTPGSTPTGAIVGLVLNLLVTNAEATQKLNQASDELIAAKTIISTLKKRESSNIKDRESLNAKYDQIKVYWDEDKARMIDARHCIGDQRAEIVDLKARLMNANTKATILEDKLAASELIIGASSKGAKVAYSPLSLNQGQDSASDSDASCEEDEEGVFSLPPRQNRKQVRNLRIVRTDLTRQVDLVNQKIFLLMNPDRPAIKAEQTDTSGVFDLPGSPVHSSTGIPEHPGGAFELVVGAREADNEHQVDVEAIDDDDVVVKSDPDTHMVNVEVEDANLDDHAQA